MVNDELVLLDGPTVKELLKGCESQILDVIRAAYVEYDNGKYSLPHSVFLNFPDKPQNRIIGLPAYLGGEFNISGLKWVSSFPDNISHGVDRASAVLLLNNTDTGRPIAILEASAINACRTAASAALAAQVISYESSPERCSFIGCGYINFEIAKYVKFVFPSINEVVLFDLNVQRAEYFAQCLKKVTPISSVKIAESVKEATSNCKLISFGTTAGTPWIVDPSIFEPGSTLLHISLRDLDPNIILSSENIVDDDDHVCRSNTSLHLAEISIGNRSFISESLPHILNTKSPNYKRSEKPVIFSPFGLGVLDIAVGSWLLKKSISVGAGNKISNFFPQAWCSNEGDYLS